MTTFLKHLLMPCLLYILYIWAWVVLYKNKLYEQILRILFYLPDQYLKIFTYCIPHHYTTDNRQINILWVINENNQILTNKFKIYMAYYWETSDLHQTNGFSFLKASTILRTNKIQCYYCLGDDKIYKLIIYKKDNTIYVESLNEKPFNTFLGHITFDLNNNPNKKIDDLIDLIKEIE